MKDFLESFSNRDIAIVIWTSLAFIGFIYALIRIRDIRNGFINVLRHLFKKHIFISIILTFSYICLEILILNKLKLFGPGQIKDTVYWIFGMAFISLFSIPKIKEASHFKEILITTFKATIIVEFLLNLYVFNLPTELILVFLSTFISLLKVVSDQDKKNEKISKILSNILSYMGYFLFIFTAINIVNHLREIPTFENLNNLLIVPILTVLYLPFLYIVALYANYETLFIRITFLTNNQKLQKSLKDNIVYHANVNINKLKRVSDNLHKHDFFYENNFSEYIKHLTLGNMYTESVSGLIDRRNVELWRELQKGSEIKISREDRSDYLTYCQGNKCTLHVPKNNINSDSFTHELLHIELRQNGIFVGAAIKNSVASQAVLSKILSAELLDHIGNCLDHIKMLPRYLNLGYDEQCFIQDYAVNKLPIEEARIFEPFFDKNRNSYSRLFIDLYIGKFFAIKACPNSTIDYTASLDVINRIDEKLYKILDDFIEAWKKFDPLSTDPILNSYHMPVFEFVDRLEIWTRGKNIT